MLRPLLEDDWDVLVKWNRDPEVVYFAEGHDAPLRSFEEVQEFYRTISRFAYIFIAEVDGRPVGEAWLEEMNIRRVVNRYPDWDTRRLDLSIGEKDLWGRGWGSQIVGMLTRFAFTATPADAVFGCYIADYNVRSRRAFEKNGFVLDRAIRQRPGGPARLVYDYVMTWERYQSLRPV